MVTALAKTFEMYKHYTFIFIFIFFNEKNTQ